MQLGALEYLISLNSNNLSKDIKKADNKLTSWAVAKGQMIGRTLEKAMASAGDGLKKVVGGAFSSFADYEQLTGGVETLFKDSAVQVKKFAEQAYKTAGISANEYMETVTSFSASLLQSLNGDTDKAADYADMAIKDMADNANKMGSSMESIQNAYQGFAKQNYTMLDNLKLGYGGTKTEMQRLLSDAGKLVNRKFDIKNLSDVYEAIHIIQQEMGIFGTTKKEAEETIAGSMKSAKAAWKDLLTAMGSGKNVPGATKRFVESAQTVIKNATPVITRTISNMLITAKAIWPSVKNAISDIWKSAREMIKGMVPKSVRSLINIGGTIINRLTSAFKQNGMKGIIKELRTIGSTVKASIAEALKIDNPDDASWGKIGSAIVQSIKDKIAGPDATWGDIAKTISEKLRTGFKSAAVRVLDVLGIEAATDDDWKTIAGKIGTGIRNGFGNAKDSLKLKIADILGLEADGDTAWATIGKDILGRIKNGFTAGKTNLRLKIADLLGLEEDGDQSWKGIGGNILSRIRNGITAGGETLKLKIADLLGIEDSDDASWTTIAGKIKEGIKSGISSAKLKLAELLGLDGKDATWGDIGGQIVEGIGSAFTKGKSILFKLILGEDYKEGAGLTEVGAKLGEFVKSGFEEGGWANTFLNNFADKFTGIVTFFGKAIEGFSKWLDDKDNISMLVGTISKALAIVADSIGEIITPLADAVIKILTDPKMITSLTSAITSLSGAVTNLLVGVITSPDLWAGLAVLADNLLRTILGDNLVSTILGNRKKLEYYTGKDGQQHVRAVEDKEAEKQESWITQLFRSFTGVEKGEGNFWDRFAKWMGGDTNLFDVIFDYNKCKKAVEDLSKFAQGEASKNPVYLDFVARYSSTFWGPNNPDHVIGNFGAGGASQFGLVNVLETKAKGDWNVSHDMIAMLHQGETVLTKSQARRYREGGSGDVNYAVVGGLIGNAVEKAMGRVYVMMSGEKVGDLTTRRIKKNLNANSYSKLRALGG